MVDTALVCDVVSGNPLEGITPENEKRLKSKKKSHPNQTDEDRWRDIYRLLFPHEDVPCPCQQLFLLTFRLVQSAM